MSERPHVSRWLLVSTCCFILCGPARWRTEGPLAASGSSSEHTLTQISAAPLHFERNFGRGLIDTRNLVLYGSITLLALFVFGYVKGRFTGTSPLREGVQTVLVGGLAAGVAFMIARAIA